MYFQYLHNNWKLVFLLTSFKAERFFKTWGQVFFYSVVFTIVSAIMVTSLTTRNWISVFFPITGNSHGFAASYLAFYLLIPFLSIVSAKITQKQLKWLLVLLVYFQVISQIIGNISQYYQPIFSELLLFILCYFIALYLKKYPVKILSNKLFLFLIVLSTWLLVFFIWCLASIIYPGNELIGIVFSLCNDESSVLYLIGGYAFFLLFNNIKILTSKIINRVAHTTFGILLIHDHNFFRYVLWSNIFHSSEWWYSPCFLIKVFICVIIIFVCGAFIDYVRQKLIENPFFSLRIVRKWINKIDNIVAS